MYFEHLVFRLCSLDGFLYFFCDFFSVCSIFSIQILPSGSPETVFLKSGKNY